MRRLSLGLALAAALYAADSRAQNLLQNGAFDQGVSPWSGFLSAPTFSTLDALGFADSGSMRGTYSSPGGLGGEILLSECMPVTSGTVYERRYDYLIVPAAGLSVSVHAQILWYGDAVCSPDSVLSGEGGLGSEFADGAWHSSPDPTTGFVAPPAARGVQLQLGISRAEASGSVTAHFDNVVFKAADTCALLPEVLCLGDHRFQVEALWRTSDGQFGRARVKRLTDDTGYLWFFNPDNVEAVIKVLDACNPFERFWVFAGGLTDVEVDIFVTDKKTGVLKIYHNDQGQPFAPVQDTNAFATCP
ncbi:MAG TPA: hypothetical protein VF179_02175 [Thermoanaerobaculia bacterium]|nr:hypothetical protein [Thermoanaerobaculia bacterium]